MENSKNQKDRYAPEKLMQYHAAVAIVENMEKQNLISARDRRKMLTVLTRKCDRADRSRNRPQDL